MGYVFMILTGAILGWIAAFILRSESTRALKIYIGAGMAGALLTGLVIDPALMGGDLAGGHYTIHALFTAVIGAIGAIVIADILRRQEIC